MTLLHYLSWGLVLPAAFVAYLFIALYIYAPFKVRSSQSKAVTQEYFPIELTALPPDLLDAFHAAAGGLASCGYSAIGTVGHHVGGHVHNSFISIWRCEARKEMAQVIGIRSKTPDDQINVTTLVTFRTEFRDETAVVTHTSKSVGIFPNDLRVDGISCPGIHDIPLLFQFHQARVQRAQRGRVPTLERLKDPIQRMQSEHAETYQRLVKAAYYELDEQHQRYQATWKGAFLMTYKVLPPFKQVRRFLKHRLADRALRELGFGGMAAFKQSQSSPAPHRAPHAAM